MPVPWAPGGPMSGVSGRAGHRTAAPSFLFWWRGSTGLRQDVPNSCSAGVRQPGLASRTASSAVRGKLSMQLNTYGAAQTLVLVAVDAERTPRRAIRRQRRMTREGAARCSLGCKALSCASKRTENRRTGAKETR